MIKSIVSIAIATVLIGTVAYGQTSSSSTTVTTSNKGVTETTTTTETTGMVKEYIPGQTLVLKTDAEQPLRYKFSKNVTYVTADGIAIEASEIRKHSKVHVHYIKEGDDMLVDKVIVTKDRD
jgi:hypothetical protein